MIIIGQNCTLSLLYALLESMHEALDMSWAKILAPYSSRAIKTSLFELSSLEGIIIEKLPDFTTK